MWQHILENKRLTIGWKSQSISPIFLTLSLTGCVADYSLAYKAHGTHTCIHTQGKVIHVHAMTA
jgi:hypothetical protein